MSEKERRNLFRSCRQFVQYLHPLWTGRWSNVAHILREFERRRYSGEMKEADGGQRVSRMGNGESGTGYGRSLAGPSAESSL